MQSILNIIYHYKNIIIDNYINEINYFSYWVIISFICSIKKIRIQH